MRYFSAFFTVIISVLAFAQPPLPLEIGCGGGISAYQGALTTIHKDFNFKNVAPAFSTHFRYGLNERLSLRLNVLISQLKGDDMAFESPDLQQKHAVWFNSPLLEFALLGEVYPLGLYQKKLVSSPGTAVEERRRVIPFIMAGIGGASCNPIVKWKDAGMNSESVQMDESAVKRSLNLVVPLGLGFRIILNKQLSIDLEGTMRPALLNYLNDVDHKSNPVVKDWYFAGGLSLSYAINKAKDKQAARHAASATRKIGVNLAAPDRDKDGIPDKTDECPDEPGSADTKGCPDNDHNGIADKNERVSQPVPVTYPDSDGDGIADNVDVCPAIAGVAQRNGCPEFVVKVPEVPFLAVYFGTNKDVWTKTYTATMDRIVKILKKDPSLNASIEGHSDSVGKKETNLLISERRAKKCYDYLVTKGINPKRLKYVGYGADYPSSQYETSRGKQLNRRVEVYFMY